MRLMPVDYHKEHVVGVETDFLHGSFATGVAQADGFTFTHAVGAIATGDALHGRAVMTTTAADNQFLSIWTTNEIFQFLNDCPIRFKGLLQPGATAQLPEELNIFVGCMEDADTATELQDAGAGPRADSDMFGFYTPEAGGAVFPNPEVWHAVSSFGANQQITPLIAANPANLSGVDWKVYDATTGDGILRELVAEWVPTNVVPGVAGAAPTILDAEVRFWLNGQLVCKHQMTGTYQITMATAELMNFGVVICNITDISVLNVDYLKCEQLRYRGWD